MADMRGVKSLGETLEMEGRDSDRLRAAWTTVDPRVLKPLPTPDVVFATQARSPTSTSAPDLPIEPVRAIKVTHLFDIITEHPGPIDVPAVTALLKAEAYSSLPAPFVNTSGILDVNFNMQVNIEKNENGAYLISKWIHFEAPQRCDAVKIICCIRFAVPAVSHEGSIPRRQIHASVVDANAWGEGRAQFLSGRTTEGDQSTQADVRPATCGLLGRQR